MSWPNLSNIKYLFILRNLEPFLSINIIYRFKINFRVKKFNSRNSSIIAKDANQPIILSSLSFPLKCNFNQNQSKVSDISFKEETYEDTLQGGNSILADNITGISEMF